MRALSSVSWGPRPETGASRGLMKPGPKIGTSVALIAALALIQTACISTASDDQRFACLSQSDCVDGYICQLRTAPFGYGVCLLPSELDPAGNDCTDGVKSEGEADVDCGGPCAPCEIGQTCGTSADCSSSLCDSGACVVNPDPPKPNGALCSRATDCLSGFCGTLGAESICGDPCPDGACSDATKECIEGLCLEVTSTCEAQAPGVFVGASCDCGRCLTDQECVTSPSLVTCTCPAGFEVNPADGGCINIDECQRGLATDCIPNTTCVDTDSSYLCECLPPYVGDNTLCELGVDVPHLVGPEDAYVEMFDGHDSTPGSYGVVVDCDQCHAAELNQIHDNQCFSCHPSPANTLSNYQRGCSEGSCHVTFHDDSADAHAEFDTTDAVMPCNDCHGWDVEPSVCDQCHFGGFGSDTSPPVTSSDTQPSYLGPARITYSIQDGGLVGVGTTYSQVDGAVAVPGGSLLVEAAGDHTLEFWSVDQDGNLETPANTAQFTILADTTPPVTTSNAFTSYFSPANIVLTATDASTLGVKSTFYTIDGGPTQQGTRFTIPQQDGVFEHTITFWSEDWSGNSETPNNAALTITGGTVTLRMVWGDCDVTGNPPEPTAWADWTIYRGPGSASPVVASGAGAMPGWSGVDDVSIPVSNIPHFARVNWWDSVNGWDDQTDFADIDVSVPGELIRVSY